MFPTSTGLFSISDLPFEPQGIFFIGTNSAVEDTQISVTHPAIFFGMVWIDYLTDLPDSQAVCLVMGHGINVKPHPIVCASSTGCAEDYRAELLSINSDGFTLNVTNPASADRPISWMAYGGYEYARGSANLSQGTAYVIGAKVLTAFAINYRTSGSIRDGCEDGLYTTLYLGGCSYPTVDDPPNYGTRFWGSAGTSHFSTTGGQGFTRTDWNINPSPQFDSAINIDTGDFPPIVLENRIKLWRVDDVTIQAGGSGGPLRWMSQWWQAECYVNNHTPPSTVGNTNSWISGNVFLDDIQAAMYIGITGPEGEGGSAVGRLTIGFITDDSQGCVAAAEVGSYLFQSTQTVLVARLDSVGVIAASGELDGDRINVTTELNTGLTTPFSEGGFIAWGPAGGWFPQVYRRWPY